MGNISIFYQYLRYLWYRYDIVVDYSFVSYQYNNHAQLHSLLVTAPTTYRSVFLISSYGTPLAQRATYVALHTSLIGPVVQLIIIILSLKG